MSGHGRRGEAIDERGVVGKWGRETKIMKKADEALKAAIAREDLTDTRRRGGQIGQVSKGVEQRKGRIRVQRLE